MVFGDEGQMSDPKKLLKNWRVLFLIVCIIGALISISPQPWADGAAIRSIQKNSSAELAGIPIPSADLKPTNRERITAINNRPVINVADFEQLTKNLEPNRTITIKTTKSTYRLLISEKPIGITAFDAPITNIRTGLDLQGGTRVLLRPEKKLPRDDLQTLILSMKQRLNVYGLSDLSVRDATDLSGNQFIVVEIAGVSEEEVQSLLAKQGKFEAKIGNDTAFVGGKDITFVCRSAECSGLDPSAGCGATPDGQVACRFRFSITLTEEAAKRQAAITNTLQIIPAAPGFASYLSKPIDLFLDDQLVDTLQIGADLKGSPATQISISGSGVGPTQSAASDNALREMNRLQTVLITGSLPVKLDIIKTDAISSSLGEKFAKNAVVISLLSILAVVVILIIAYRKLLLAIPIFLAMVCEVLITLGLAAFIGWNIDLAAVAGIIAAVGTGVDDQIVMTDEALKGSKTNVRSWKDKMKNAFFIIMGAYLTVVVAMVPLIFAGAGLLKGFAITTIIGVSVGVFITRPAYAAFLETFFDK
ncbi:MAG: MMPL family transporter [Nanoarchaeota archaeon]